MLAEGNGQQHVDCKLVQVHRDVVGHSRRYCGDNYLELMFVKAVREDKKLKKSLVTLLLLLTLPFCLLFTSSLEASKTEHTYKGSLLEIYSLLKRKKFKKAEREAGALCKAFPAKKANVYMLLAFHSFLEEKEELLKRTLQKIDTPPQGLEDIYLYLKASQLHSEEEYSKSRVFFLKLFNTYKTSAFIDKSLLGVGKSFFAQDKFLESSDVLKKLIKLYPQSRVKDEALWVLAQSEKKLGDTKSAVVFFRRIIWNYPISKYAPESMKILNNMGRNLGREKGPNQLFKRAMAFYRVKRYSSAERDLKAFCKRYKKHRNIPKAILLRGKMAFNLRKNRKALKIFSWLIRSFPRSPQAGEALFSTAMTYWRMGKSSRFLKTAKLVKKKYRQKWGAKTLYTIGKFYEEKKDWDSATECYRSVIKNFKPQKYFHESMWSNAWVLFITGKLRMAEEKMAVIVNNFPDSPHREPALFWRGAILNKLGKKKESIASYKTLLEEFPYTFLGHKSRAILKKANIGMKLDTRTYGDEEIKVNFSNIYIPRAKIKRIKKLIANCLFGLAVRVIRKNTTHKSKDKKLKTIFELSKIAYLSGNYMLSINLLRRHFIDKMVGKDKEHSVGFWKMSYPLGFAHDIEKNAKKYNLDPYLIASVIRAESAYNVDAISRTHAVGLMQIQPKTARRIAKKAGFKSFGLDVLAEPEVNIGMGSFYLKKLLEEFDGNYVYAIASYNAGEKKVHSWVKKNGELAPIEFILSIPYRETRGYVRRVLGYIDEYKRIYGSMLKHDS